MSKMREFWAIRSTRDNYDLRTIKPKWEEIPLGYERIHLIEYQAYKTALQTLKEISLSTEFIHGYGDVPTEPAKKALETLKELGEHE